MLLSVHEVQVGLHDRHLKQQLETKQFQYCITVVQLQVCSLYIHRSIQDVGCKQEKNFRTSFKKFSSPFSLEQLKQIAPLKTQISSPHRMGKEESRRNIVPSHWLFFTEICPFDDCVSSLSRVWLKRWMRAPGTRAMHAIPSSCSSRWLENRSSSDDTSESMTPVWTHMKLYGRRPAKGNREQIQVRNVQNNLRMRYFGTTLGATYQ